MSYDKLAQVELGKEQAMKTTHYQKHARKETK